MAVWIGIDPGLDGAVAWIDDRSAGVTVADTPVLTYHQGRKVRREYMFSTMRQLLEDMTDRGVPQLATLERVGAMPGQGVASMFAMGHGLGVWKGLLAGLGIPFQLVTPVVWKRRYGLLHKDKDASRVVAQQRFPRIDLQLKKHHGRADALFLALYGKERHESQASEAGGGRAQHPGDDGDGPDAA